MKHSIASTSRLRKLKFLPLFGLMALGLVSGLSADEYSPRAGNFSKADFEFAQAATTGGMMEVQLGAIAAQKGSASGVKEFGQQMVTDHGQAGEKLKSIAATQGATLPDQPTEKQQKEIARLSGLNGEEFDREYISLMVKDHRKDLKEFKHAAESLQNPELKSFAAETATVVEHHLMMAKNLSARGNSANQ